MSQNRPGLLIVVSGPSGAGKGTILGRLFQTRQDCVYSISATTRKPRPGEVDGKNYFFISLTEFNKWIEEGRFVEWAQTFSSYYGTPRSFVEEQRALGKHVILEIDVKGGLEVMKKVPDCVSVFLSPPSWEVLEHRLRGRGTESSDQVAERLLVARTELKNMDHYSYTIINEEIATATAQLNAIIEAEMLKTPRVYQDGLVSFAQVQ